MSASPRPSQTMSANDRNQSGFLSQIWRLRGEATFFTSSRDGVLLPTLSSPRRPQTTSPNIDDGMSASTRVPRHNHKFISFRSSPRFHLDVSLKLDDFAEDSLALRNLKFISRSSQRSPPNSRPNLLVTSHKPRAFANGRGRNHLLVLSFLLSFTTFHVILAI